jgi:hypothetical protein
MMVPYDYTSTVARNISGNTKPDRRLRGLLRAVLASVVFFTTIPLSADEEVGKALISFQANTNGESLVIFGDGVHRLIDTKDMREVGADDKIELPTDVLEAIGNGGQYDFVIVYEVINDNVKQFRAIRCHRHANGIRHCH